MCVYAYMVCSVYVCVGGEERKDACACVTEWDYLFHSCSPSLVPLTHSAHYCLVGHNLAWGRVWWTGNKQYLCFSAGGLSR